MALELVDYLLKNEVPSQTTLSIVAITTHLDNLMVVVEREKAVVEKVVVEKVEVEREKVVEEKVDTLSRL